jgi:hypothetical protein
MLRQTLVNLVANPILHSLSDCHLSLLGAPLASELQEAGQLM